MRVLPQTIRVPFFDKRRGWPSEDRPTHLCGLWSLLAGLLSRRNFQGQLILDLVFLEMVR